MKSSFQKSWKKSWKKNFFSLCGYGVILENKKKEEEELHKLEWASRNEKRAHWNKNRSKGKKNTILSLAKQGFSRKTQWKCHFTTRSDFRAVCTLQKLKNSIILCSGILLECLDFYFSFFEAKYLSLICLFCQLVALICGRRQYCINA